MSKRNISGLQAEGPKAMAVSAKQGTSVDAYIRPIPHPLASRLNYLRWLLTIPFTSFAGYRQLRTHGLRAVDPLWRAKCAGRRVLIVGTGPSLDRVDADFFAGFDTFFYINYAIRLSRGTDSEFFFSTDLGPITDWMQANGCEKLESLGAERCLLAPFFFDQYPTLTAAGRGLFSVLACDAAGWMSQKVRVGPLRLPLILRYSPRQPDWTRKRLSDADGRLPVMRYTSALSAVLFAAMQGAAEIGLIGCDFSAGRASSAKDQGSVPNEKVYGGASVEFRKMAEMLAREGVTVTNHSWLV